MSSIAERAPLDTIYLPRRNRRVLGNYRRFFVSTLPEGKQLNIAKTDVRIQMPQTAWIFVYSRGRQKAVMR
jgi:hypothetical protein